MIYAKVKGQHLEIFSDPIYSDSVNFLAVKFELSKDWDGYSVTAIYRRESGDNVSVILDEDAGFFVGDNTYLVPYEVITVPSFSISLIGTKENSRITTNIAEIKVKQSGFGEGNVPDTPSLSEYEQLLLMCNTAKDVAQSVRDDLDNGEIKGEKGDKGDTGERGPQGIQGDAGPKGDKGDPFTYEDFTEEQLSSLKGEKGEKGQKGDQGIQGEKGDKGDTGEKGEKGEKGDTGKTAYQYAQDGGYTGTEEEYAEDINPDNINQKSEDFIITELAKRGQLKPEFANDVSECTDTTKLYVLPDGYIYGYMLKKAEYTNQIPISTGTDGAVYDSDGYAEGIRLSSSGVETSATGYCCTGFIPCVVGDTIRMKNIASSGSSQYIEAFDDNKTFVIARPISEVFTQDDSGIYSGEIWHSSTKYFRISITKIDASSIITVNEEIKGSSESGYKWSNTGHTFVPADYEDRIIELEGEAESHEARIKLLEANEVNGGIPEYWLEELESKADTIKQAMESAGRNKSAFLWYTDAHWDVGNSKLSPLLLRYLIKNTSMSKVNFGGDIIGNPTALTHDEVKSVYEWREAIKELTNHHSVIGNHDNLHKGRSDSDVSNMVYSFLIAPEESNNMVMGDDFYYYIDNPCEKTRYLYLDSGRFSLNDDETKFIIGSLTSTPSGWHIVVISHIWFQYTSSSAPTVGSINGHMQVVLNLLDAYNARESGSVTMSYEPHSYDFSDCGGRVEFCIGGHIHVDYDFTSTGGIPVIITASDTNQERSADETEDSGTVGTTTEAAVFGIIADYNQDATKITVVGVGRGTSRIII